MTDERITIVSADGHAGPERMADYAPYLDPRHRAAFADYAGLVERYDARFGGDLTGGGAGSRAGEEGLWDFALRTRHLDEDGVAAEIIFTQGAVPFWAYPAVAGRAERIAFDADAGQLAAGCRAYNRWLAERCARDPARHHGVARVPLPDIDAAVAEVAAAAALGLRGGVALPPLVPGSGVPDLNDPRYEPFWAACEANGMTLNMHGGANMAYGVGPEAIALVLAETDWFSHRGLAHLIFAGVFERHPRLHLAITEQRIHWVEATLRDYDSIHASAACADLRRSLRRPSEYFATNCFLGASFMSRPECAARGELGRTSIMWGSDYPHEEGVWPHTKVALRWTFDCGVPPDELRALLGRNAVRCYGLDEDALRDVARRVGPTEAELRMPVAAPPPPAEGLRESWAFRREGAWH